MSINEAKHKALIVDPEYFYVDDDNKAGSADSLKNRIEEYTDTKTMPVEFYRVVLARYARYEINTYDDYDYYYEQAQSKGVADADEDAIVKCLDEWRMQMLSVFLEHYDYYNDKITVYNAEFHYGKDNAPTIDEVRKRIAELVKSNNNTTYTGHNKHSDLPNKQIDPNDIYNYPTMTDENTSTNDNTNDDSTLILATYRSYINGLRNIYDEFAKKFDDCFMHTFGTYGRYGHDL